MWQRQALLGKPAVAPGGCNYSTVSTLLARCVTASR
jgi:hypothetical protein